MKPGAYLSCPLVKHPRMPGSACRVFFPLSRVLTLSSLHSLFLYFRPTLLLSSCPRLREVFVNPEEYA